MLDLLFLECKFKPSLGFIVSVLASLVDLCELCSVKFYIFFGFFADHQSQIVHLPTHLLFYVVELESRLMADLSDCISDLFLSNLADGIGKLILSNFLKGFCA